MGEKMTLHDRVEFALRDAGFDFDEASRIAHLATPAQTVDIEAVREVIACTRMVVGGHIQDDDRLSLKTTRWVYEQLNKLSQAIGDKT